MWVLSNKSFQSHSLSHIRSCSFLVPQPIVASSLTPSLWDEREALWFGKAQTKSQSRKMFLHESSYFGIFIYLYSFFHIHCSWLYTCWEHCARKRRGNLKYIFSDFWQRSQHILTKNVLFTLSIVLRHLNVFASGLDCNNFGILLLFTVFFIRQV